MAENSSEEISVQEVFNSISDYLKNEKLFERLLDVLHEEPCYKDLLETGKSQFFDAASESTIEKEQEKTRSSCPKVNYLAVKVEKGMDKIIQEKFQGEFLDKLKDKVLQAILLLSSDQMKNSDVTNETSTSIAKSKKGKKRKPLSPTLNNNCVQNKNGKKKAKSNGVNGQTESHLDALLDKDYDTDFSMISFDSVSSVHTSDLSSFEDEISLSSDEEVGRKRRLSLREVQEKLEKSKFEEMDFEENKEQVSLNQGESAQSDFLVNNSESSTTLQKSQRRRKPNSKYTNDDLPFKKKPVKKTISSSRSVCGDTPRRRGRPRKHST